MTNTTQTRKANEMTTKLVAIGIALVIGTIVVVNIIGMFQSVTASLTSITSF